ncbi:hypothetical protein F8M49_01175 [Rhodococcus zopfii]|uniref:Transposase n=1 Tax=Rhodococcus zopfii TaxID=43772 RepID=A0ABU3WL59_9NOCA|nr:hypothetical protein [Rhodococcus zopfii]
MNTGSHGRARRFVGRRRNGEWVAVGVIDNVDLVASTTAAQLEKYDKVRRGQINWSNDSYRPLTSADHPQRTLDLDRETSR